ncbi:MAG: bifunctional 4-hydroxy-2-oxoglutarate aldolase/2-dehydro-3-deoxy-phosphogluconate aldolase [Candidatus Omnitrophica bacterium]|nr:bifunctional 4-hydroxy-2-oxoglutarate aldolase/2-dehydro-3-deoxy-phosphogluconate aldolase [Candidatus Omnitrophota bacterium]MDD5553427.1 bifunctional 4-hydroxy-2-oxoglutarate aldolase/2-dehydro-3-deoxy-phosphogluconate aldolase [Candidatus Omnitrophota bacterium]
MVLREFKKKPVMGIVRGLALEQAEPLVEAAVSAGLETLEITMNTKDAAKVIKAADKLSKKRLTLGAGTVLDMDSLKTALDSGATFIVMPVLIEEVLAYCVKNRIPAFPGALTPQEIYSAWRQGASMVKVFPARSFGPEYFKEIKGPFEKIELLAVGGVTPENLGEYFACGASAVAFGSSVFKREWLQNKEYRKISWAIKAYVEKIGLLGGD